MSGGRLGNVLKLANHVPGLNFITVGEEGNRLYWGADYSVIACPFVHQTSIHTSHIEKSLTFSSRKTTQSLHQFLHLDQILESLGDEQFFSSDIDVLLRFSNWKKSCLNTHIATNTYTVMEWRQQNHIKNFQSEKKQKEPPVHTVINPASWELLKCHALAMTFLD